MHLLKCIFAVWAEVAKKSKVEEFYTFDITADIDDIMENVDNSLNNLDSVLNNGEKKVTIKIETEEEYFN